MIMPLPYRADTSPVLDPAPSPAKGGAAGGANSGANGGATGFGAAIIRQGDLRLSSVENSKMRNFVRVLSNSAPSPIVPASKHYTTSTVLSSGEALKKTNFVWVLFNSGRPGQAPTRPHFIGLFGVAHRSPLAAHGSLPPDISGELPLCQALIPQPRRCSLTAAGLVGLTMEGL